MFWPFTVWISCSSDLKHFENSWPSALNFKSFSQPLEQFFLAVGRNNFVNKIPFLILKRFVLLYYLRYVCKLRVNAFTLHCQGNKIVLVLWMVQKNNYRRDEVPWWLQNADLTLFSSSLNTFFVSKIKNTSLQMQWYKNVSTLVSFVMVQCIFTIGEITIQSYYY